MNKKLICSALLVGFCASITQARTTRPNSFIIGTGQAGSTLDVSYIKVKDLDSGSLVYSNGFTKLTDATNGLIGYYWPQGADGSTNHQVNSAKTSIVNGKLRIETTGFNQNGDGGYNSDSEVFYTNQLPKNFYVEIKAQRQQWAGASWFGLFREEASDTPWGYVSGGALATNRNLGLVQDIVQFSGSGNWFNKYGIATNWANVGGVDAITNFPNPAGSWMDLHTVGIALSNNIVTFYLDGANIGSLTNANWMDPFSYASGSNGVTILGYTGTNSTVTVPSMIGGLPVTSIGDNAFANQSGITSVLIPNSVTNIGSSVFSGCSNLTSVTIPDSVLSFGTGIFSDTRNVSINGSSSLIGYLSQNASVLGFSGNALTSIQNGGSASTFYGWIESWLASDNTFVSKIVSLVVAQVASNPSLANLMPKANQTLNFPSFKAVTLSTTPVTIPLKATSSAKLTNIIFSSGNDAVASVVSNSLLTINGAGSTTITASSPGNTNYMPASAAQPLVVNQAVQTLKFAAIPTQTLAKTSSLTLGAASSANLPVTYSVANTGVAIVSNNVLLLQGTGSTTVTATNAGNSIYLPASATQTLIVK